MSSQILVTPIEIRATAAEFQTAATESNQIVADVSGRCATCRSIGKALPRPLLQCAACLGTRSGQHRADLPGYRHATRLDRRQLRADRWQRRQLDRSLTNIP